MFFSTTVYQRILNLSLLTAWEPWCPSILYVTVCLCSSQTQSFIPPPTAWQPPVCSSSGVPNLWDSMPDDLRWSWRNNRNKVHNKRIMLESSETILLPSPWKICLSAAGPWYQKVWGPLPCRTCKLLTIQVHMWSNNLNLLKICKDWDSLVFVLCGNFMAGTLESRVSA